MGQRYITAGNDTFPASSWEIKLVRHGYNGPEISPNPLRAIIISYLRAKSHQFGGFPPSIPLHSFSAFSQAPQELASPPDPKPPAPFFPPQPADDSERAQSERKAGFFLPNNEGTRGTLR